MKEQTRFDTRVSGLKLTGQGYQTIRMPFNSEPVGEVQVLSRADIEGLLNHLTRAASPPPPAVPERMKILRAVAADLLAQKERLALLIASEGGKPLKDALVEVERASVTLTLAAEEAGRLHGDQIPMERGASSADRMAFTIREPIGLIFAISAFNHPLNLIAHQVGSAVAAGCPVIVKPAIETPLSCFELVNLLRQAGLPDEMAVPVICENEISEWLASSDKIRALNFIGSARVGWHLRSRLAPGVRLALEHGGVAPAIVDETADLAEAIKMIVKGGYYHAGQVCVSTQRVFIQQNLFSEFTNRLTEAVNGLKVGDPRLRETDVGPLIRRKDVLRVDEWVNEAKDGGAKILTGGRVLAEMIYAPTVMIDAPLKSRLLEEEVFGPVLALESFTDLEEGIALANSTRWSFQSSIFTKNIDRALTAAKRLNAAAVLINQSTAFRVDWMPFGGRGASGLGTSGIPYSVREMTQEKLIVF